jgi:hypothetical protein
VLLWLRNDRSTWLSLFLLGAATLAFEINLTRLFSVSQFYHLAFMIVSIALLGFGASGTALSVWPALQRGSPEDQLARWALGAAAGILGSYLLINWLPFDSFSIAWDRRQAASGPALCRLAAPFSSGLVVDARPFLAQANGFAGESLRPAAGCVLHWIMPVGCEGLSCSRPGRSWAGRRRRPAVECGLPLWRPVSLVD